MVLELTNMDRIFTPYPSVETLMPVCSLDLRTARRTPADCEAVNRCHERLDRLWESHPGVPLRERARFETALVEVVGNVVRHARPGPGQRVEVAVELSVDASFLEARVHEFGAVHVDIPHLRARRARPARRRRPSRGGAWPWSVRWWKRWRTPAPTGATSGRCAGGTHEHTPWPRRGPVPVAGRHPR